MPCCILGVPALLQSVHPVGVSTGAQPYSPGERHSEQPRESRKTHHREAQWGGQRRWKAVRFKGRCIMPKETRRVRTMRRSMALQPSRRADYLNTMDDAINWGHYHPPDVFEKKGCMVPYDGNCFWSCLATASGIHMRLLKRKAARVLVRHGQRSGSVHVSKILSAQMQDNAWVCNSIGRVRHCSAVQIADLPPGQQPGSVYW